MYSLGSQAKRPHKEDSDDGTHPQEPVRHSIQDRGVMATNSTGGGVAAAIAASYARKPKSQVTTQLDYEEEEEVEDYFEENQEYTSPHMTYRNEKVRSSVPDASAVGVFAVQGPGIDEESQVYVSTVDENTNQGSEDLGSMNTGNMMLDASQGQEPIEARRVFDGEEVHDQAKEIAEMVHRELMANVLVPVEVKSGGPPSTQDTISFVTQDDGVEVGQRNKRLVLIAIALLAIIVAVAVGVGVGISNKDDKPDGTTQPPPLSTPQEPVRSKVFQEFLAPISGELLKDITSPQYQALNWLANVDAANMTIGVDSEAAIKTRYVAAVLYYAFQGDTWTDKYSFLSDRETCSWNQRFVDGYRGIACGIDGIAESFQLPANNLVGSFPREIGYFSNLIDLDLSDNMIDGSLESLVNLTHLATLNVSMNALMGTLPDFLFTHRSLTNIDLQDNRFSGSISYSLGKSDQLRVFWARNNSLTGTVPSAVGQSWVLGSLILSSNQLTGTIPDFVSSSRLWNLHLAQNKLTGTIPTTIGSLSALATFQLAGNGNVGSGISGRIPSELGKCQNLFYLWFDNNTLAGTIPSELGLLSSLETLSLWNNRLSGAIPAELSQCTGLVTADFAGNELTGFVPSSLSSLTNLDYLHFDGNNLTGGLDAFCGIDFEIFSANLCTEPDTIECACCTHCCRLDSLTCSQL